MNIQIDRLQSRELAEALIEIVCQDDDWVQQEFDEMMGAAFGVGNPSQPGGGPHDGAHPPARHAPPRRAHTERAAIVALVGVRSLAPVRQRPPP